MNRAKTDGIPLTCQNPICRHGWIYRGKAKFYAQCPQCLRKVKIPGRGPSPQEAVHEDLKHIRRDDLPQNMFREFYAIAREAGRSKLDALMFAKKHFEEQFPGVEPQYEAEYWSEEPAGGTD